MEIKVDDAALIEYIETLKARSINMYPAMREIAGHMSDAIEKNFEAEGRPRWQSLAETTIRQREKQGYWPGRILQQTGQLVASITQKVTPNYAMVGTNKVYAAIQHLGGNAGRGGKVNIPARPYLTLERPEIENMKNTLLKYITMR
ncbi:MAG: phage virion morphogenesis protein [Nitrospiraceae bacterium]|nr:phage virion morphogenesis protein [Nitrospiraceae bacterium]